MVRVIDLGDTPWFVGKDVASVLGYKDTAKAVTTHCKHGRPVGVGDSPTPRGLDPQTIVIPEGDMYRLVLRSNLPSAERFEAWVMDEVLPSIRRTGSYASYEAIGDDDLQSPDGLKLSKVRVATRCFGERAGAQLWVKLGLEWVPAMAGALSQADLLDNETPPGTVTIKVTANGGTH